MAGRVVYPPLFCPVVLSGFAGSSALTINGATQTANFPALSITQTWNNSGVVFGGGIKQNITNTASAAGSLSMDLQVGGTSIFQVGKGVSPGVGIAFPAAPSGRRNWVFSDGGGSNFGLQRWSDGFGSATAGIWRVTQGVTTDTFNVQAGALDLDSATLLTWNAGDLRVLRAGAATLQMGADTNGAAVSQQLQAANGITGTDRTGGNFTLASGKGTGAGAASQVLIKTPSVLASGTTAQSLTTRVTIDSNGLQATGYLSSDGSAGVTAGPYTTITSITVKNGLITAIAGS